MLRSIPLKSDPAKIQAWHARSQPMRRTKMQKREPHTKSKNGKSRRNDAPWRNEVMELRGKACRACDSREWVQCDHVWPRSQGGPSVVENGLPLCRVCHEDKTASLLKIRPEWLDDDQLDWLAEVGWVEWNEQGQPQGRGWRHFEEVGRK